MSRKSSELRLLLLQIRDNERVRREEHDSFAVHSGLAAEQIELLNVFDTPHFSPHAVDEYDALLVGGASEASVLEPETYPFIESGKDILMYCIEQEIPVFASCFGFQLAVVALGGEVIKDNEDFEMGVIPIKLSAAARNDPIYRDVPDNFMAVSVHQEKTTELPKACELLAYTDHCIHSFRVKDKPFWTFQFHPEVDRPTIVERLTIYKDRYTKNDEQLEQVLAATVDTPESNGLVGTFVKRILITPSR
jgi:GMP synthase (glutamine-hydrolysing)